MSLVMTIDTRKTDVTEQDRRWQALVERDPAFDGKFVYAVSTTGVYCRPSCASSRAPCSSPNSLQPIDGKAGWGYPVPVVPCPAFLYRGVYGSFHAPPRSPSRSSLVPGRRPGRARGCPRRCAGRAAGTRDVVLGLRRRLAGARRYPDDHLRAGRVGGGAHDERVGRGRRPGRRAPAAVGCTTSSAAPNSRSAAARASSASASTCAGRAARSSRLAPATPLARSTRGKRSGHRTRRSSRRRLTGCSSGCGPNSEKCRARRRRGCDRARSQGRARTWPRLPLPCRAPAVTTRP